MTEETNRVLVAGAFGFIGTLVPIALSWNRERSTVSQRARQLDEATKRVQFWDSWLKLSTTVGDPTGDAARQRVQHELEMLCELLGGATAMIHTEQVVLQGHTAAFNARVDKTSWVRRVFLLYKPARHIAWVPRIFFFLFLFFAIVGVSAPPHHLENDFYGGGVLIVIAVGFRFLSTWIEKPRKRSAEILSSTP